MSALEVFKHADSWASLATLTGLEIVLGIDNIVFLTLTTNKLPEHQQPAARTLGLSLALFMRLGLLFGLTWVMSLTANLFTLLGHPFSARDLILLGGGLFLLAKSTHEMFERLEVETHEEGAAPKRRISFAFAVVQIVLLDIVFSLDSVITAVGMVDHITIMIVAVMIAVGFMMVFAGSVSSFISRHPTVKVLALSFLLLIGTTLVAEGFHVHFQKGFVYFAMAFSVFTEMLNIRMKTKAEKKRLEQA